MTIKRFALFAAIIGFPAVAATPAHATPLILPLIEGAVLAAGLPTTFSVFGFAFSTAALITGLVTTGVGRGLIRWKPRFQARP